MKKKKISLRLFITSVALLTLYISDIGGSGTTTIPPKGQGGTGVSNYVINAI